MVDMAHFSGLVAGGAYPNPTEYADVVTSTTHKVLRGPRGGMTNNARFIKNLICHLSWITRWPFNARDSS